MKVRPVGDDRQWISREGDENGRGNLAGGLVEIISIGAKLIEGHLLTGFVLLEFRAELLDEPGEPLDVARDAQGDEMLGELVFEALHHIVHDPKLDLEGPMRNGRNPVVKDLRDKLLGGLHGGITVVADGVGLYRLKDGHDLLIDLIINERRIASRYRSNALRLRPQALGPLGGASLLDRLVYHGDSIGYPFSNCARARLLEEKPMPTHRHFSQ